MYPLVSELAADGIPVAVACRVLKIARQPYYRWLARPVTSAEEDKGKRHILCVDASSGAVQWIKTFEFQPYRKHQYNTAASATPVVDSERVYTTWTTHETFTVTAVDHGGKEAWTKDFGSFPTQHGGAASPMLCGDILVVTKEAERAVVHGGTG